jgi:hypothetical protein
MAPAAYDSRPVLAFSPRQARGRPAAARLLRGAGALALLVMAGVHLQQLLGAGYSQIPTIGVLFWLDVAAGVVLALAVLAWDSVLPALAGLAVAAAALVALFVSESTPLFGFMESGYRPAILVAIVSEAAAVLSLGALVASSLRRRTASSAGRSTSRRQVIRTTR